VPWSSFCVIAPHGKARQGRKQRLAEDQKQDAGGQPGDVS